MISGRYDPELPLGRFAKRLGLRASWAGNPRGLEQHDLPLSCTFNVEPRVAVTATQVLVTEFSLDIDFGGYQRRRGIVDVHLGLRGRQRLVPQSSRLIILDGVFFRGHPARRRADRDVI